jgi:hypothetical protein
MYRYQKGRNGNISIVSWTGVSFKILGASRIAALTIFSNPRIHAARLLSPARRPHWVAVALWLIEAFDWLRLIFSDHQDRPVTMLEL